mgnify:CR=1 FL=1
MRHTQHKSNNVVLGAPSGMSIDECHALPVTRFAYPAGTRAAASYWLPNEQERALIAQGKPVCLVILGDLHPPVALGVDGDDTFLDFP